MRVECHTLEEFIEDLSMRMDAEGPGCVFQGMVRATVRERASSDGGRKFIAFQASAVVEAGEGQYLLQVGVDCGVDYTDSTNERPGSEAAAGMKGVLKDFCSKRGLIIGPGKIEI